jgi:hypothetical protein
MLPAIQGRARKGTLLSGLCMGIRAGNPRQIIIIIIITAEPPQRARIALQAVKTRWISM